MESEVSQLLRSLDRGDQEALQALVPVVYGQLRAIARRRLRHERPNHTLNTTALVHEAFLKIAGWDRIEWRSRAQFLAVASQAMRRVLVNYALRRKRVKRGGGMEAVPFDEEELIPDEGAAQVLALDAALLRLETVNPRQSRIVECRCFGGLTVEETATALDLSPATIKREWVFLLAWLRRELEKAL
jgi:RNA polymerase sigma factor (TIGR02999 family)